MSKTNQTHYASEASLKDRLVQRVQRLLLIINWKTLVVTILAVISTYLCRYFDLTAEFPLTLIATALVFPVVFSIGGAYKRREAALDEYGSLKAHGRAIYFAARDWLDDPDEQVLEKARSLLGGMLASCRQLFSEPIEHLRVNENQVYDKFSELSEFIRHELRENGMASGEVSRCNQFLSKMFVAFESIKHVYQYRTPRTLRAFSEIFIMVLPPLYGPYFAQISKDYTSGLEFVMPVLFSLILVSLYNIQSHLENPFDQVGEDDVSFSVEEFVKRLK